VCGACLNKVAYFIVIDGEVGRKHESQNVCGSNKNSKFAMFASVGDKKFE
jgi:hypothetical protein